MHKFKDYIVDNAPYFPALIEKVVGDCCVVCEFSDDCEFSICDLLCSEKNKRVGFYDRCSKFKKEERLFLTEVDE